MADSFRAPATTTNDATQLSSTKTWTVTPNPREREVPVADMSRSSALHIAAGVNDAAALDDVLRLPPMQQQTLLCSRDSGKNTPLHIASYKGHIEFVVKILSSCTLEHYALDLPNLLNDNGNTPLHLAVLGNNLHVIQALISASPPSRLDVKDKQGYTPMHYACGEGYLDIVKARMHAACLRTNCARTHTPLLCRASTLLVPRST